tara:strand:+ start:604 stop:837 length:234 start_codon:yes stop_codon:yes gene_type:complete
MNSNLIIDVQSVEFSNESSKEVTFTGSFTKAPSVTAIASDGTDANYSFFVDVVTRSSVTIGVSQNYTGTVDVHAIGY